jgi:hypothetical protein
MIRAPALLEHPPGRQVMIGMLDLALNEISRTLDEMKKMMSEKSLDQLHVEIFFKDNKLFMVRVLG